MALTHTKFLFTYGTLMKGMRNEWKLRDIGAKYVGKGTLTGALQGYEMYYNTDGDYPYIVPGKGTVVGEIYEVSEEMIKAIDRFEGVYCDWYRRVTETVEMENGVKVQAEVYIAGDYLLSSLKRNKTRVEKIPDGDFKKWVESRNRE